MRAFFLEDVNIDPKLPPPPTELVDSLRELRRKCGDALRWETTLQSRSAKAPKAEAMDVQDLRVIAVTLRRRTEIMESVHRGELPALSSPESGGKLLAHIARICNAIDAFSAEAHRINVASAQQNQILRQPMSDMARRMSIPPTAVATAVLYTVGLT